MKDFQIPILRIPFDEKDRESLHRGIEEILDSGNLTMGRFTAEFEAEFARAAGARHAVACANGTAALELILRALEIEDRSVIVPTNTFLATALAALHAGNRVLFADTDPETLGLDLQDVERRIAPDTSAVIAVHIGGYVAPSLDLLAEFCRSRGLHLIEDCAHAHGSTISNRHAGTIGVAGAFSFFPTKVLVTGEGGIVVTNDGALADRMRMIRNHGKDPARGNRMSVLGGNYRMSELTALLGVQQTRRFAQRVQERRSIAAFYDRELKGVPHLRPVLPAPQVAPGYYKYIVRLDEGVDRTLLKRLMKERHGVSLTGEVYADLCHTEPLWERFCYCGKLRDRGTGARSPCRCPQRQEGFPGAERFSRHHACLPLYPGLKDDELHHVTDRLHDVLDGWTKGASCAHS